MIISLDYDDTITRDPKTWMKFITLMQEAGHTVHVVTMRKPVEETPLLAKLVRDKICEVHYTCRKAKQKFMFDKGINVHVWVDDQPAFILYDAAD